MRKWAVFCGETMIVEMTKQRNALRIILCLMDDAPNLTFRLDRT